MEQNVILLKYLYIKLSIFLAIYLSIYLERWKGSECDLGQGSIYLTIYLSVYLSREVELNRM